MYRAEDLVPLVEVLLVGEYAPLWLELRPVCFLNTATLRHNRIHLMGE